MSQSVRFRSQGDSRIGVEYEMQLLDGTTLDLCEGILPLLKDRHTDRFVHPEYNQFTVEIATRPCADINTLRDHLKQEVSRLHRSALDHGMRLCGAGTHPFNTRLAPVTPLPRYRQLEREMGYPGYRQIVFGHHVHIGMADGEECIFVLRQVRPLLPLLLALSASSPYWFGIDTGFASYRSRILTAAHTYGTPPSIRDWEDFSRIWHAICRSRTARSLKDLHWDLRPRPDLGTLEFRIMDSGTHVDSVIQISALCRALVEYCRRKGHGPLPTVDLPPWIEIENRYRASRLGLEASCIIDPNGKTRPLRRLVVDVLHELTAMPAPEDCRPWLQRLGRSLLRRPAYQMLREEHRRRGSFGELVRELVRTFEVEHRPTDTVPATA